MTAVPADHSGNDQLVELGFYGLAGHSDQPADLLHECRTAEHLGLGSVFISERFNVKDAGVLSGAAAAATTTLGIATAATNHNTRHPMVTATLAATMHRMSGGRFALGLGRGFDALFTAIGLQPVTSAQLTDAIDILRRLWRGETILAHDGPSGRWPYLATDTNASDDIPVLLCALGTQTLELAGAIADGVVLHTFFTDAAVERSVAAVRRGAERAGRNPDDVRVWSVLATVGDHIDHEAHLRKLTGRLATYLQVYGDLLVRVNDWDPAQLEVFRRNETLRSITGAIDATATTDQLEQLRADLPEQWLAAAATGTADECAATITGQFDLGVNGVICHGATPDELAPVLAAYRGQRDPQRFAGHSANPGR
jgi:probable F420-dependent oxidoreductase